MADPGVVPFDRGLAQASARIGAEAVSAGFGVTSPVLSEFGLAGWRAAVRRGVGGSVHTGVCDRPGVAWAVRKGAELATARQMGVTSETFLRSFGGGRPDCCFEPDSDSARERIAERIDDLVDEAGVIDLGGDNVLALRVRRRRRRPRT